MKTKQAVTVHFRNYGNITIPKGTHCTKLNIVSDLSWINPRENYPLFHDAYLYGIHIPVEFIDFENTEK